MSETSDSIDSDTIDAAVQPDAAPSGDSQVSRYKDRVLRIQTPLTVTLARSRVPLSRVISLVPGSMLTFDAHCDEPLTLEAGDHPIARGETVKIGDKFGMRIREIIRPVVED
ncbi:MULTISPECIES: FliM/FliN family flagellar motor switch protein [Crateriforma]|uniref:FliM/FliN family flagellar motor switch protein n=1 Tax=Crateriforma TaxID=2714592 RepID=UPI0011882A37|nr:MULTISPECIES: FliM/FliN family flagellar motor C-terminal domain-containing protein [Crateriforma]QDV61290.1 Flagellar motor switch protein FliN [Crateriforma conspicua]